MMRHNRILLVLFSVLILICGFLAYEFFNHTKEKAEIKQEIDSSITDLNLRVDTLARVHQFLLNQVAETDQSEPKFDLRSHGQQIGELLKDIQITEGLVDEILGITAKDSLDQEGKITLALKYCVLADDNIQKSKALRKGGIMNKLRRKERSMFLLLLAREQYQFAKLLGVNTSEEIENLNGLIASYEFKFEYASELNIVNPDL